MKSGAENERQNNRDLIFLAAFLSAILISFELWMAARGQYNERDQHLGGAVAYAKGHIDLLRPMLLGFTANGTPTPLEFPLWQACTAALMKCFGLWHGWGNVVSLFFFFSSLFPLFDLCRRINSSRVGWWAVIFTLIQPLSWLTGGQAGGDSTAWAFAAWFIYAAHRMISEGRLGWWLFSLLVGSLSAMTKAPFFAAAGLTSFFWLWCYHRQSRRAWFCLTTSGIIATVFFLVWNYHCHKVYAEAEFPTINLDPFDRNSSIHSWYFETLAYRLHVSNWLRGGWHLAGYIFGSFTFIFLLLTAIRLKHSSRPWLWLLAGGIATLVFPSLILEHIHYFFIFASAVAWLCGLAAAEIESKISSMFLFSIIPRTGIIAITLVAALIQTLGTVHFNTTFNPFVQEVGQLIDAHTSTEDKIIVWGMNWGEPFLFTKRQGFTGGLGLDNSNWINEPEKLNRVKQLGYTKIVLINTSPLTAALTAVTTHTHNDTDAGNRKIQNLHEHIPGVARDWPVVFDSQEVLILQIPNP